MPAMSINSVVTFVSRKRESWPIWLLTNAFWLALGVWIAIMPVLGTYLICRLAIFFELCLPLFEPLSKVGLDAIIELALLSIPSAIPNAQETGRLLPSYHKLLSAQYRVVATFIRDNHEV